MLQGPDDATGCLHSFFFALGGSKIVKRPLFIWPRMHIITWCVMRCLAELHVIELESKLAQLSNQVQTFCQSQNVITRRLLPLPLPLPSFTSLASLLLNAFTRLPKQPPRCSWVISEGEPTDQPTGRRSTSFLFLRNITQIVWHNSTRNHNYVNQAYIQNAFV